MKDLTRELIDDLFELDKLLEAISELIDDLHDNHDYASNFVQNDCSPDHGYQHVATLLRIIRRHSCYRSWADSYLEGYDQMLHEAGHEAA